MATYYHSKPLLAAVKVQKASPINGTSKKRAHTWIDQPGNGGDKWLRYDHRRDHLAIANTLDRPFVGLSWAEETSQDG